MFICDGIYVLGIAFICYTRGWIHWLLVGLLVAFLFCFLVVCFLYYKRVRIMYTGELYSSISPLLSVFIHRSEKETNGHFQGFLWFLVVCSVSSVLKKKIMILLLLLLVLFIYIQCMYSYSYLTIYNSNVYLQLCTVSHVGVSYVVVFDSCSGWVFRHTHASPRALYENSNILTNQVLIVIAFQIDAV